MFYKAFRTMIGTRIRTIFQMKLKNQEKCSQCNFFRILKVNEMWNMTVANVEHKKKSGQIEKIIIRLVRLAH